MTDGLSSEETRVLNPRPRRHHRRTYSTAEVRIGGGILLVLAGIGAWVAWKGVHPDPSLFADPRTQLDVGVATVPVEGLRAPGVAAPTTLAPAAPVDRGLLPKDVAASGWRETALARFTPSGYYDQIERLQRAIKKRQAK